MISLIIFLAPSTDQAHFVDDGPFSDTLSTKKGLFVDKALISESAIRTKHIHGIFTFYQKSTHHKQLSLAAYCSIITAMDCGPSVTDPLKADESGFSGVAYTREEENPSTDTVATFALWISTL